MKNDQRFQNVIKIRKRFNFIRKSFRADTKVFIPLIFLSALIIRLCFAILTPAWQSADEYPHYWVIEKIASTHALPESTPEFPSYEAFQPPLYYIIAAFVAELYPEKLTFSSTPASPPALLIMLRLLSVIAGVFILYFSYLIFKNIPDLKFKDILLSLLFLSFLPTFVGVTSTVNNDTFAILFSTISLYYLTQKKWDVNIAFMSGLWAGIAILTKLTSVVLVPVIAFRIITCSRGKINRMIKWGAASFLAWSIGAVILIIRNIIQYGSLPAVNPGVQTHFSISGGHFIWALRNLFWSFWMAFGRIYQVIPNPIVYLVIALPLTILAIAGWFRIYKDHDALLQLIAVAVFFSILSSLFYTFSYLPGTMTSWGKNLYPVLPFFAIFFVAGWNSVSKRFPSSLSISAVLMMLIGSVWALFQLITMR